MALSLEMEVETFEDGAPLTGSTTQLPFCAERTADLLAVHGGVRSIWQLFGKYLEFGRDQEKLASYLRACCVNPGNVNRLAAALAQRVQSGFAVTVPLSKSTKGTSELTGGKRAMYINTRLNGNLLHDFLGLNPISLQKMAAAGVTTSDQLFAQFLSLLDEPTAEFTEAMGDKFYRKLTEYGVAGSKASTPWNARVVAPSPWTDTSASSLIDCIVTKLEYGIDSGS